MATRAELLAAAEQSSARGKATDKSRAKKVSGELEQRKAARSAAKGMPYDPNIPELPWWSPQGNLAWFMSPPMHVDEQREFLERVGNEKGQDKYGNPTIIVDGKEYSVNRPGASGNDVRDVIAEMALFALTRGRGTLNRSTTRVLGAMGREGAMAYGRDYRWR